MVFPHIHLSQHAKYRENYIVQGNVLWCRVCNAEVDHIRKDSVDKHLHTANFPTDTLIQEWWIYCELNEPNEEFKDLDIYWQGKSHLLPELSALALIYIWLPVFGVDIERSFSNYKSILSDRRIALKEESIQMLNFLYFNLNGDIDYDLLISK